MPRPTLFTSTKFALAHRRLKISAPLLLGHLEFMWATANENGEPEFPSWEHVEVAAKWEGAPGEFCKVLSAGGSGFLDASEDGSFTIHDYWDHVPDYVRRRRLRELERKQKSSELRTSDRSTVGHCPVSGGQVRHRGCPPTPAPTPTQEEDCSEPRCGTEPAIAAGELPGMPPPPKTDKRESGLFRPSETKLFLTDAGPYEVLSEDVAMWFPVVGGKDDRGWPLFKLHAQQLAEPYRDRFAGEEFKRVIRKAQSWVINNPGRRKTPKGMAAFLSNFLARECR